MPLVRLDTAALRLAGIALDAPLCLSHAAWGSEVDLPEEDPGAPEFIAPGVGYVSICGPLAREPDTLCGWYDGYQGEQGIAARFKRAATSPESHAVLMHFHCEGGTSEGIDECVAEMQRVKAETGKPVVGFVELAASAGYWIAAGVCDVLLAAGLTARAGSIGCYIPHESIAGLLAKQGIEMTLIADPPGKVAGNPYEKLSELGLARFDRSVKACTGRFKAVVTASRGLTDEQLVGLDGDLQEADLAIGAGLLDGLADLETAVALALALADERAAERTT